MIVTVSLNAALDLTYEVERLTPGATHRVASVGRRAGGKGVNTARVLTALGEPALALGLAGGATGAALRAELDASGVPQRLTPVAGESRRTVTVVETGADGTGSGGGEPTGFWEPGAPVSAEEFERFVEADFLPSLAAGARAVVLSGSLPPGVPVDAYARLVRLAAEAGVPTLVDADGPVLRAALTAAPALVKPNQAEAGRALAPDPSGASDPGALAAALVGAGARAAVVSAGAAGLAAHWGGAELRCAPPRRVAGNPTGAGDAASAALALALARGDSPAEALAHAVALSAAAVAAPLAGAFDPACYAELLPLTHVLTVPS